LHFERAINEMLDRRAQNAAGPSPTVVAGYATPLRRHLAIVDPSQLRRDCLRLALSQQPKRWRIIDTATAAELATLLRRGEEFDVVLLGGSTCAHVDLADIALLTQVAPRLPVLVAAECDDASRALAILRAGARGYLPTSHSLRLLVGALERVRAGGTYVPLSLNEALLETAVGRSYRRPWSELTRRQCDVLVLVAEGKANKLIAEALNMSESTVKAHVKQIIRRLNVANRTQAALLATKSPRGD
jgi:DNA-binding NarL/FixJ family response regulator